MSNKARVSIGGILVLFSVWFYFTPHLAVNGMKSAAEEKNAAKLASYVNFQALKDSLKASFNARLASEVVNDKKPHPYVVMGAAMAAAFVNPMIDALVTPESLTMIMKGDKPEPTKNTTPKSSDTDPDVSMSYESFDRFLVTVKKNATDEPLGLVFNRDGMFSWKLSALRLPM